MLLADIKKIEAILNITIPEELANKYTSRLLDGIEDFPDITALLILDPNTIISLNQKLRREGLWKKPFPKHLLAIGHDKNQIYITNLHENPLRVFRLMNNTAWRYNPDNLEHNLVCSVPGHEGLDTYVATFPLSFLRMKLEQKHQEELGLPEPEIAGDNAYTMLEQMAASTFDKSNWPKVWKKTLIEKFLTTEIDLNSMSIVHHDKKVAECVYDSTPENAVVFANTGVDGVHYCVVPKYGVSIDEAPVYCVSPMDWEDTVVWVAKDFIDFLSIGVAMGSFTYISCCCSCNKEEFLNLIEESWAEDYMEKRKAIKILEEHFPLRKYDDIYRHLIESYKEENNHAILRFTAINEIRAIKLGHYNRG